MRRENSHDLEATVLQVRNDDVLELDKLWSFVGAKKRVIWLWVGLCRRTRQVVAWYWDDRSAVRWSALWNKIPDNYKRVFC